jgi:hypothetical protein
VIEPAGLEGARLARHRSERTHELALERRLWRKRDRVGAPGSFGV